MVDLQRCHGVLLEEIRVGSVAGHELQVTEFFNIFASLAAENGDTPDMEYCPILKEGAGGYRVDGYALDLHGDGIGQCGDLYLAVCDYRQNTNFTTIVSRDVEKAVTGVERFYQLAQSMKFLQGLEEASPAFQLAILIQQCQQYIRRLRVIVFTNAQLRVKKKVFECRTLPTVSVHTNVLDLDRYAKISSVGPEPVEIDFVENFDGAIECLRASTGAASYQSYLFAIPGSVLARVYAIYGNRLLEQNVRTYLQARTGVNKGILRTIAEEPGMFFAYNNGLTATASAVEVFRQENGALAISRVRNFQIVNGGQTTASLLYAREGQGRDLSQVYVQIKLSVVEEDRLETVVPRISEYANTQNKVSLDDLASNSPVQVKIERLSKEVSVPQAAGALHTSRWFYERARGQYKNLFSYKSTSERNKLQLVYPKDQLLTKTDLAKYYLSFEARPHHVSEGAQKCFARFIHTTLLGLRDNGSLNEVWYRRVVAKALLFIKLDEKIMKSEWYKKDRGYKAQITTYTVAACAEGFRLSGVQIDLDRIWREQKIPEPLLTWMFSEAVKVADILKAPPDSVRNVTEFAKREFCWGHYVKGKVGVPDNHIKQFGVALQEFVAVSNQEVNKSLENQRLDFEIDLLDLAARAQKIIALARLEGMESPRNMDALSKLAAGQLNLSVAEKTALKKLLQRLEIAI